MKSEKTIVQAIKNIRYYAREISDQAKQQIDDDIEIGKDQGLDTGPAGTRFTALAAITESAELIDVYCHNIESNVAVAANLDRAITS